MTALYYVGRVATRRSILANVDAWRRYNRYSSVTRVVTRAAAGATRVRSQQLVNEIAHRQIHGSAFTCNSSEEGTVELPSSSSTSTSDVVAEVEKIHETAQQYDVPVRLTVDQILDKDNHHGFTEASVVAAAGAGALAGASIAAADSTSKSLNTLSTSSSSSASTSPVSSTFEQKSSPSSSVPTAAPSTTSNSESPPSSLPLIIEPPASLLNPPPSDSFTVPSPLLPEVTSMSPLIRGVLWFDCVYPTKIHRLDPRHLFATHNHETLIPSLVPDDIEIVSMTPRMKDGGVFVEVETRRSLGYESMEDIADVIARKLKANPRRALFTSRPVLCHVVKGNPFLDDIQNRFPAARLKMEIRGPPIALQDLTVEHLFHQLRAFGRINEISLSNYVKDAPRTATCTFRRLHGSIGARNCLHRLSFPVFPPLPPTIPSLATLSPADYPPLPKFSPAYVPNFATIFISYDSILQTSYITEFASKHPRIMVPLVGLLFAAFTLLIFDPLRVFNIENKITQRFTLSDLYNHGPLHFIQSILESSKKLMSVFGPSSNSNSKIYKWNAHAEDEEMIKRWMNSLPDSILFLTGTKGVGKNVLVQKITKDRRNVVHINVANYIERTDDDFLKGFSADIGFAPGFALLTYMNNIMDILTPGASKASGASQQFSSQAVKVLEVTTRALMNIANKSGKKVKTNEAGDIIVEDSPVAERNPTASREGETQTCQLSQTTPDDVDQGDNIPLFIFDGFTSENISKHSNFFLLLMQWAAHLTGGQMARFMILSDGAVEETVTKSLPDAKVVEVNLSEADTDSAYDFIVHNLGPSMTDQDRAEVKEAISIVGGRYADLLSFVRQLETDSRPNEVVEDMVNTSMRTVRSYLWNEDKNVKWTRVQLWQCIRALVDSPEKAVDYDHILFNIFQGDEAALRSLVRADFLRVEVRPQSQDRIRAGSPLYMEAFARLTASNKLRPGLDLQVVKWLTSQEMAKINAYEEELAKLHALEMSEAGAGRFDPYRPPEQPVNPTIGNRRGFLLQLLTDSHNKVVMLDEQRRMCEKAVKAAH